MISSAGEGNLIYLSLNTLKIKDTRSSLPLSDLLTAPSMTLPQPQGCLGGGLG